MVAILHANGDTRSPLIVLSLSGLLNVILNSFFVFVLNMSVDGVAIATAIANACSAVALFTRLSKENGPCRLSFKKLKFNKTQAKQIRTITIDNQGEGNLAFFVWYYVLSG